MSVDEPEAAQRGREADGRRGVAGLERVCDRGAEVRVLRFEPVEPLTLLRSRQRQLGFVSELEEVLAVPVPQGLALAHRAELLEREVAQDLEHREARSLRPVLSEE